MSGNSLPLGYNHDDLINKRWLRSYDLYLSQNINSSEFPDTHFSDLVWDAMYLNNPKGLNEVHFSANTSLAVEQAVSAALLKHETKLTETSSQDFENKAFNGSVIAFEHSNHSKTLASCSLNNGIGGTGGIGVP